MRFFLLFVAVTASLCADPFEDYRCAEVAPTVAQARELFTSALEGFLERADERADGRLLYNIGNCYFQLEEIPTAILYYRRALSLSPRDQRIRTNLAIAEAEVSVASAKEVPLFLATFLSLNERLLLVAALSFTAFALSGLVIWARARRLRAPAVLLYLLALYVACGALYDQFLKAPRAVVMQASIPRLDGGSQYAAAGDGLPLCAGTLVKVVGEKEGWLHVRVRGVDGYIPAHRLATVQTPADGLKGRNVE